ncbi:MAG TPA: hypothetical protein VJ953_07775 [Saprospiraceae bacterium]|nr:hypothetical protein [Saprospiraceae bacterium]
MKTYLSLSIFLFFLSTACQESPLDWDIQTVRGPISTDELGKTLIHEHILVDFIGADSTGYHRWDRAEVVQEVLPYLQKIKDLGFTSLIECTPSYLGRDPQLLKTLSEKSGLQILTNTGYYGAQRNKFIPEHAFSETAQQLADRWIKEWEEGIEGTGIKPGFIKISVDQDSILSPMHRKLIRAAAITHRTTGLTIASHTLLAVPAFQQMDILKEEGVAPDAFIWVHAQAEEDLSQHVRAARGGAWISLDNVNADQVDHYVEMLSNLKENDLLHRVLISHDAGWYSPGEEKGGDFRAYTDLNEYLLPALRKADFSEEDIDQMLVHNPAVAFGIRKR